MNTPQSKIKDILYLVQILSQNDEISPKTRKEISFLLSEARMSNDFSRLNAKFKAMSYGITPTLREVVDQLISLTAQ